MTEAGQLKIDDAVWHGGKLWWVANIEHDGRVCLVDAPEHSDVQVRGLLLDPHENVTRAGMALLDARGEHMEAVARMRRCRRSLDFEIAAQQDRRAVATIETLEAAGIVARYEP